MKWRRKGRKADKSCRGRPARYSLINRKILSAEFRTGIAAAAAVSSRLHWPSSARAREKTQLTVAGRDDGSGVHICGSGDKNICIRHRQSIEEDAGKK